MDSVDRGLAEAAVVASRRIALRAGGRGLRSTS